MQNDDRDKLAKLIRTQSVGLLTNWRELVRALPSARHLDTPTLNDHLPGLLEELASQLELDSEQTIPEALVDGSAPVHGLQRLRDGFDIQEVVAEYNVLRGCIHDVADQNGISLQGKPFHIVNRVFDGAIGVALQTYATGQALEVQRRREEYLAFVAHDLRTPLSVISMSGRVLEQKLIARGAQEDAAKILRALDRSVQQLRLLVTKVLEENTHLQTAVGTKLEMREVHLWAFIEALMHDLHPVADTSATKISNQVPEDLIVYADASLLTRIFQNLIANAIKYTPRGEIIIGAREVPGDCTIESWVSDNGAGIPEAFLGRVFDKGETDPESTGGAGLGLTIVKSFTEAHGGKVSAESQEGVGSTFRVWLPALSKEPRRAGP